MNWDDDLAATAPGAAPSEPAPDAQTIVLELSRLAPVAYDQRRDDEATRLGVRVSTLDKEVAQLRGSDSGGPDTEDTPEPVETIEPWPDAVAGLEIAEEIRTALLGHVVFPSAADADAAAIWCLGAYLMNRWRLWSKLLIRSPEKRCGKSTLMEVIEAHTCRPLMTSNITAASLFRCIEAWRPTLLIDEADRFLRDDPAANGIINAGHTRRTARVIRTIEVNGTHEPRAFSVRGAQAIASIGAQMDTLEDRSIRIGLRRKLPSETVAELPVEYFEQRQNARRRLLRWADDNGARIAALDIQPRACGNDRAQDNWAPLYRIAAVLGGPWPERINGAYLAKEAGDDGDDDGSAKVMALRDVMSIFEDDGVARIESSVLVANLNAMEDRPWPEWRRGKPLTQNGLARLLRDFGIKPRQIRFGTRSVKGYEITAVADAFTRYCQPPPISTETPKQSDEINGLTDIQTETFTADVSVYDGHKSLKTNECFGVSVETGGWGNHRVLTYQIREASYERPNPSRRSAPARNRTQSRRPEYPLVRARWHDNRQRSVHAPAARARRAGRAS